MRPLRAVARSAPAGREVCTRRLGRAEARASTLHAVGPDGRGKGGQAAEEAEATEATDGVVLARTCCEFDYRARRLGMRCGHKQMSGEHTKRHVHTLRACVFRPAAALLALGAALTDDAPTELPEGVRARWLVSGRAPDGGGGAPALAAQVS